MSPRVTVLLAVHNGEPFLHEAVTSVLTQTYGDFEFLVVDDASSDGTAELLRRLDDPRVRVLRNERNLGQVPSLNRGLREARGEYVARIDHDDVSLPRRLERQVAVLDAEPQVGLVGTWMNVVDERDRDVTSLRATIDDYVEFLFETLRMHVLIAHPAAMFRREPVLQLGGYDESTGPAEDKDLWRRLALERWDARIVREPLVVYRLHDAQLSQTQAGYQREVDGRSQERFLAALAPETQVRALRLLLSRDAAFWHEPDGARAALGALERVLAGTRERLGVGPHEAERLERLLATHVASVARDHPWSPDARALVRWSRARQAPSQRRVGASRHAAALLTAPPLRALRTSARLAGGAADSVPALRALRRPLKRLRAARTLYAKLIGSA